MAMVAEDAATMIATAGAVTAERVTDAVAVATETTGMIAADAAVTGHAPDAAAPTRL